MAIVITSFQAQNAADLEDAINTFLATLTNPKINRIDIQATEDARTLGRTYRAIVTTQTGGSVIATPWVVAIFEGQNASDVADECAALVAAGGSSFFGSPRIGTWYSDGGSLSARCFAWIAKNATAGASANWLPT